MHSLGDILAIITLVALVVIASACIAYTLLSFNNPKVVEVFSGTVISITYEVDGEEFTISNPKYKLSWDNESFLILDNEGVSHRIYENKIQSCYVKASK